MGYFPNGDSHDFYRAQYCDRCANAEEDGGCPVMDAHFLFNYKQIDDANLRTLLQTLIPEKGTSNEQCRMFRLIGEGE